jgi:peptidyl-prolyl cis-trans isomerase B (cyclophilin B)
MTSSRRRTAGPILALLAVPLLLAACRGVGGGGTTATDSPAEPSATAAAPADSPSAPASGGSTGPVDVSGCPTAQPDPLPAGKSREVTISTTEGDIVLDIQADLSPIAAGNFVALADCGWYDGVVFHRVVPGFVIQGGDGQYGRTPNVDPDLVGTGGPPYTIEDEPVTTKYARGTVAMARTAEPDSVGSQFFIVLDDNAAQALADPRYNNYQIIGSVTSGLEVVDAIAAAAGDQENPTNPIVMTDVSVATP